MQNNEDPRIVDLRRYRQAAKAQADALVKAQAAAKADAGRQRGVGGKEPLLGSRRHAGLLLILGALALLALTFGPQLLRL